MPFHRLTVVPTTFPAWGISAAISYISTYEGGVRVPFVARWPGKIPAMRETDEPIYYLSGRSVQAIRVGDWKCRHAVDKAGKDRSKNKAKRHAEEERNKRQPAVALYNLRDDVGEEIDLFEQQPEIAARLKKQLETFSTELQKTLRPPGTAE